MYALHKQYYDHSDILVLIKNHENKILEKDVWYILRF